MYCQQNWHEYNTKQDTTYFWALYKMTVDIKKKKSEGKEKKESKRRKKEKILLKGKGELQMDKKRLIYIIIGPVLFALSSFTLGGALTQPGAMAFGTLLWMVFWWVTRPVHMTVTALLPGIVNAIFAMVPMGSVTSHYASGSIILIFGTGLLSLAWARTGLDRRVALKALSLIGPSMKSQIIVWLVASIVLSMMMPNVAVVALYTPIAVAMLHAAGYEEISKCPQAIPILLAIGWGAGIGGVGTPLGGAMNVSAISFIQEYIGTEFMYIDWIKRSIPYLIILTIIMLFCMLYIGRGCEPIKGTKEYFDKLLSELGPMSRDEKLSGILFLIAVFGAFARPLYANLVPNAEPAYIFLIFGCVMFLLTGEDKKPFLTWEAAQENSLWGMMLLFGGGVALGNLVNESGAAAGIASIVGKLNLDGGFTTFLIFAVFATILSEMTNSTVSAAVTIPIVISITSNLGLNPIPYWFATVFAYNAEFLLPVSVRAIPISYGLPSDQMMKKGIPMVIVRLLVALIFGCACIKLWPGFGTLSNWSF